MTKYQYHAVPFIGKIKGGQSAADVSAQLTNTLNNYAAQGWELYQLGDVNIEVQPGCFDGLFGKGPSYIRFDQLIFRRAYESDEQSA